jgi:glycosyltransferase involved in cell wall biosynthesis
MPDVTVLMAVHNGERYLARAIDSVLAQTHRDFELLIVDDGSTDGSVAIAERIRDGRVRVVRLAANRGLSEALNAGLAVTRTELVARLDADDEAVPERLATQRAFMLAHPALALVGSQAIAITPDGGERGTVRRSIDAAGIAWTANFDNPFIHPSVMFRASLVRDELGGYRKEYDPFSQDYDLWCRVMERHPVANLPDRLIRHRVHDASIMGQLDRPARDAYGGRFVEVVSTLVIRQARRSFSPSVLADDEARLLPRYILGLAPTEVHRFLEIFERLLGMFRADRRDTATPDFRLTLARQFDAMAARVSPASRLASSRIYGHAVVQHPELAAYLSWPRAISSLLLGSEGRHRVGGWFRTFRARHH